MTGGTANTEDPGGRWRQPMSGFVSVLPKIPVLARDRVATSKELWSRTDMKGRMLAVVLDWKVIAMLKKTHPVLVAPILPAAALIGCHGGDPVPARHAVAVGAVTVKPRPVTITTELPARPSSFRVPEERPHVSAVLLNRLFRAGHDVNASR